MSFFVKHPSQCEFLRLILETLLFVRACVAAFGCGARVISKISIARIERTRNILSPKKTGMTEGKERECGWSETTERREVHVAGKRRE